MLSGNVICIENPLYSVAELSFTPEDCNLLLPQNPELLLPDMVNISPFILYKLSVLADVGMCIIGNSYLPVIFSKKLVLTDVPAIILPCNTVVVVNPVLSFSVILTHES
jgi:hypothetical protein